MKIFTNNHFYGIQRILENKILLNTIYLIGIIFVLILLILYTIAKKEKMSFFPNLIDSLFLEVLIWLIPTIIIVILSIYSVKSSKYLNPLNNIYHNIKPLYIEMISLNWKWLIVYPFQKIIIFNELCLPNNTPIKICLVSNGLMNSLCIPKVGCQIYCMINYKKTIYLMLLKHGFMHGCSNNFNGQGYNNMRVSVFSVINKTFYKWVTQIKNIKKMFNFKYYNEIIKQGFLNSSKFFNIKNNKIFLLLIK